MASSIESVIPDIDVCVVGGGIGGLAAGLSLQKIGCKVKIYERDNDFVDRKQGYGLTLTNNIKGPLAQLGVLDECIAQNCLSKSHYVFNESGEVLGYYGRALKDDCTYDKQLPEGIRSDSESQSKNDGMETDIVATNCSSSSKEQPASKSTNSGNLRIPRQDLREMMMTRLRPETVVWNRKLVQYTEFPSHIAAEFECRDPVSGNVRSDTVHCHVLVGADGVRSVVRRLRDKKEKLEAVSPLSYLGVAVIIGLSTVSHPLLNSRGFYVLDGTHRMFTMPFTDLAEGGEGTQSGNAVDTVTSHTRTFNHKHASLTMWQLSFSGLSEQDALKLKSMSFDDLIAEAQRRTASWFSPVQEMIAGTALGEVWGTPLYDRDAMPLKAKHQGSRVTVLGDACHPMSMFKGKHCDL